MSDQQQEQGPAAASETEASVDKALLGAADGSDFSRVDPRTVQRGPLGPLAETGVSGTAVFGGWVQDGEKSQELVGTRKYVTFANTMANVSILAAGVRYFLNLVSKPEWRLVAPEGVPGAERYAELATEMMHDMRRPWHRVIRRAALYRFDGNAVLEWTAKQRPDGLIGMLDIAPRPSSTLERWDRDEHGELYGVVQRSPNTQTDIYIPRWKMIYLVDDSVSDSPEGVGLFRHIVESVRRLRRYEQLEGWGFETDLRGVPVARAPLGELEEMVKSGAITAAERDKALLGLRNFLNGHVRTPNLGMMLDSNTWEDRESRRPSSVHKWAIELLKAEATSHPELLRAIERLNREIARVLGVEQLLLGDNGVGSFAMAKEKSHNFAIVVDGTMQELRQTFAKDWLTVLWLLNGWPLEAMPAIKSDRLEFRDVEEVTSALERIARAGAPIIPGDPAINELRDLVGLSHQPELEPEDLHAFTQPPPAEPASETDPDSSTSDDEV